MKKGSILVVFGEELPEGDLSRYDFVLAGEQLKEFIKPGSIYEASAFAEELSYVKLYDGTRLTKSFIYKGFELWWLYYNNLFTYFCLPYTQYKKLLEYLKNFKNIYFYRPPFKSLFSYYLEAEGCTIKILRESGFKTSASLPFGIFLQILITLLCIPILIIRKHHLLIFIGDKFEKSKDYDFRMKFVYQELRQRKISFVEFIRSLESWKTLLQHVFIRKRPVIYSEAVAFMGRFLGFISNGSHRTNLKLQKFDKEILISQTPEVRFKFLIATHYLRSVHNDIWAIRIMKWILRAIGIEAAFVAATNERNFHTFLGCKLNTIPTVGILHGVASRYYNGYDFLPGFDGEEMLSVDKYGLWSEWWKEYYIKNGKAYRPEQLYVSGPMRPLEKDNGNFIPNIARTSGCTKVLFISEQVAVPEEVMPYLEALLNRTDIELMISFRQYRDGFRNWLEKYRPNFLEQNNIKIAESGLQDAIKVNDVVVGSFSTSVLEALFQYRIPIFFKTQKWGDYYNLKEYDKQHSFFAESPKELIEKIKNSSFVSINALKDLRERYFGDPHKNGSKWVVDQLESAFLKGCITK